jgi:hypothetical protein
VSFFSGHNGKADSRHHNEKVSEQCYFPGSFFRQAQKGRPVAFPTAQAGCSRSWRRWTMPLLFPCCYDFFNARFSLSFKVSSSSESKTSTLIVEVFPCSMWVSLRRMPRCSAINRSSASFAFPSAGGALILIFNRSLSQPIISLRLAFALILTVILQDFNGATDALLSWIGLSSKIISKPHPASRRKIQCLYGPHLTFSHVEC